MSAPLRELRVYVPEDIFAGIEARARAFGIDKAELVRDTLAKDHRQFHRAATLYARTIARNGLQPELFGDDPEDEGTARSTPERGRRK